MTFRKPRSCLIGSPYEAGKDMYIWTTSAAAMVAPVLVSVKDTVTLSTVFFVAAFGLGVGLLFFVAAFGLGVESVVGATVRFVKLNVE